MMITPAIKTPEAIRPDHARLDAALGRRLLALARRAIIDGLGGPAMIAAAPTENTPGEPPEVSSLVGAMLQAPGATFVTLTADGELRGCIGSLEPYRPLADDVTANARAAAFSDYRFPSLTARELSSLCVEVSLLGPAEPLAASSEAEAIAQLEPGRDGIILAADGRRATFLPQVWESLPDPEDFLAHLKRKAGLPADCWPPSIALWRYQVRKWKEQ